jgi:hypothetical protein
VLQFVHYNTVLRRWPANIYESLNGNTYATTIHCLVSGVTKVSRRTRIPAGLVLYRGFGGLKLPDQFYKAPEGGFKGFVEWGFMVSAAPARRVFAGVQPLRSLLLFRVWMPSRTSFKACDSKRFPTFGRYAPH